MIVFTALLVLALFGNTRVFLFSVNRVSFGNKRDRGEMKWALMLVPPLLAAMMLLYLPAFRFLVRGEQEGLLAQAGIFWLSATALIGIWWIVECGIRNRSAKRLPPRVADGGSEVIRLRRAHIPFKWLQRLGAHNDVYDLEITIWTLTIPDLPPQFDGYTIAFMTDTHVAGFMRRAFYRQCIDEIVRRDTDLVLFGGDFVTWKRHIPLMAETLTRGLIAPDGAWAVLGNHDYWSDRDGVIAALTARGVRFLVNQSVRVERDGAAIQVAGIDEIYRGEPDVAAAFRDVDERLPVIAVSHHPDIVDMVGNRHIDLLVCGHTHGGQIRLPYFGALVVPSVHEGRYASGFHQVADTLLYVSRGLGAVPPVRILCRPELPFFRLRCSDDQAQRDMGRG